MKYHSASKKSALAKSSFAYFSENWKLVNVEDCTQIGGGQSNQAKCWQRNISKLQQKINQLLQFVTDPADIGKQTEKYCYLYTRSEYFQNIYRGKVL